MTKCDSCGSEETSLENYQQICLSCGKVLKVNELVYETQFMNSKPVGQNLGAKWGEGVLKLCRRDYRTLRLMRGYGEIQAIASRLQLKKTITEAGQRYYKLAFETKLTASRRTRNVSAVCLFIACRRENAPYLLIDFSDAVKTNVFVLGCLYIHITRALFLDLPLTDPSLYIQRYCAGLEFGEKKIAVAMTALRILKMMKTASMTTGRRPNGLCGSAILIAARYHGFKRTVSQITKVVSSSAFTVSKRLEEFKQTDAAQLTRDEFSQLEQQPVIDALREVFAKNADRIGERIDATRHFALLPAVPVIDALPWPENQVHQEVEPFCSTLRYDDEGVISLSDVDDAEIDAMLLSEKERKLKTALWYQQNRDWMSEKTMKRRTIFFHHGLNKNNFKKSGALKMISKFRSVANMAAVGLIFCLLGAGAPTARSADVGLADYLDYLALHGKSYATKAEFNRRHEIFRENAQRIGVVNADPESVFILTANKFADWTRDEYRGMLTYKPADRPRIPRSTPATPIPASVDWRDKLAVNEVRDQGQCGSCWTFSSVSSMESRAFIRGIVPLPQLAEQQLVDCAGGAYENKGCNGGDMGAAFDYARDFGMMSRVDYPYTATQGSCRFDQSKPAGVKPIDHVYVKPNSAAALKVAIAQGPVSVALQADSLAFQFYSGGVLDTDACGNNPDHAVTVVGYRADPVQGEYYIVRNSWGSSWGVGGYVHIAIKDGAGVCGIQMYPVYPTFE